MRTLKTLPWAIGTAGFALTTLVSTFVASGIPNTLFTGVVDAIAPSSGPCGLSQPAFCETFDQPAGTGNRSGQLNGALWGVSRTTGNTNLGGNLYDGWSSTPLQACS